MNKMQKRGAVSLSVNALVVIAVAVMSLVLGIAFLTNIYTGGQDLVDQTGEGSQSRLQKLFGADPEISVTTVPSLSIPLLPPNAFFSVITGDTEDFAEPIGIATPEIVISSSPDEFVTVKLDLGSDVYLWGEAHYASPSGMVPVGVQGEKIQGSNYIKAGTASITIPTSALDDGTNHLAVYSCVLEGTKFECGSKDENLWTLLPYDYIDAPSFKPILPGVPPPLPTQGDAEAGLKAQQPSTNIPSIDEPSTDGLPIDETPTNVISTPSTSSIGAPPIPNIPSGQPTISYIQNSNQFFAQPIDIFDDDKQIFDLARDQFSIPEIFKFTSLQPYVEHDGGYVYRYGYYYDFSRDSWIQFQFPQDTVGDSDWIYNTAHLPQLPISTLTDLQCRSQGFSREERPESDFILQIGDNYVAAYSCKERNGEWKCGCKDEIDCGYWMLDKFTTTGVRIPHGSFTGLLTFDTPSAPW